MIQKRTKMSSILKVTFLGCVAFPKQLLVSYCSIANKTAAEWDLLLQWS